MFKFASKSIRNRQSESELEQLYIEYRQMLYAVANKILHNEMAAEDAVHDTFTIVTKNFEKIGEIDCPKTRGYLVTIVRHICYDYIKKDKGVAYAPDNYMALFADCNQATDRLVEETELVRKLVECVRELPGKYADVLLLRYEGYSTTEIARSLEISESNVYKTEQRARAALVKMLEEKEEGADDFRA